MSQLQHLRLPCRGLEFPAVAAGDGPIVLMLHGFPDGHRSFDAQLPQLADAGYRAVSVAMRGYVPAAQPADGDYSQQALVGDVLALADTLGDARIHLVGHDWGAAVAYAAAAAAPARFASIVTMAVPHPVRFLREIRRHPRQLRRSWYMAFFQLPWLPEYTICRRDFAFLRWLWRQWSPDWTFSDADFEAVADIFRAPDVPRSALAYYRSAIRSAGAGGGAVFPVPVPCLALAGAGDGCIAADVFAAMLRPEDFPAGLRVEVIGGAGHFLHRERPDVVNPMMLEWFAAHPPGAAS